MKSIIGSDNILDDCADQEILKYVLKIDMTNIQYIHTLVLLVT